MAEKSEKKKLCFVVGPIGAAGSPERTHADWLLKGIIQPVFSKNSQSSASSELTRLARRA